MNRVTSPFSDPADYSEASCGPELPHDSVEDVYLDARLRVPLPTSLAAQVALINWWSLEVFREFWKEYESQEHLNTGSRKAEALETLREFMHALTKSSDRKIAMRVECYLAAINKNPKSQTDIAKEYGVTRAAISKIVVQICDDLQLPVARHMKSDIARESYRERALRIHKERKSKICKTPTSNSFNRLSTLRLALTQTLAPAS